MPGRPVPETVPVTAGAGEASSGELRTAGKGCPLEQADPTRATRTNQRVAEGSTDLRMGLRLQDPEGKRPAGAAGKCLAVSNFLQSPAEMPQVMRDKVMRP
jgi:hypothetical protein